MAGRPVTKETIKRNTIRDMNALGVFRPEYDAVIDIYAELCEQYIRLTREFVRGGYQYQTETMQGGAKKAPIVATLEGLRKDILAYSDRLCVNPKALETIKPQKGKKPSALILALKEADTG